MKKSVLSLLSVAFAVTALSSCEKNDQDTTPNQTATYVLVHGAWQAPYVWDEVRTDLENKGNKVVVVELPGHGTDQTPTHTLNMDVYRDKVVNAISQEEGQVILVGHSMGGIVVSAVAEAIPTKIKKVVYIGAFVPQSGQALVDLVDPDSQLGPNLIPSADQLTLDVNPEKLTYLFINDGTDAAKEKVIANYRPEPAIPLTNKVTLTAANFGKVDKVYIKTLQDIVVSPNLQNSMIANAGITNIYEVNTSHSPFLSQPHKVSELLLTIGK